MTEKQHRVLAIGIDGGTFGLLEPLARRGIMPALASLMERGAWGALRSTVPPVTAPAWTSFLTGKNPGGHGIFQFFSLNPLSADTLGMGQKSYLAIPGIVVNSSRIPGDTLWSLIDRGGLRQVTLNIPMAYPPVPVRGVMVAGMLTPPGSPRMTWPPDLADRMRNDYEIDLSPREKDFTGDNAAFLGRVDQILEKRARWSLKLLREEPWDFFMTVFTESDRLQHRFYDLLDENLRREAPPERRRLIAGIEGLYRKLDEAIAALIEAAGPETHLVLVSDHGFGPAPVDLVDLRVLTSMVGLDRRAAGGGVPHRGGGWRQRLAPTKARFYKYLSFLPEGWLRSAEAAWRRRRMREQRAVLFKMHENVGGVWVNLRDEAGRIRDAAGRDLLVGELRERLAAITWRGEPVIESVARREELYRGDHLDGAPDLVFILREKYGILEPDMAPPRGELVVTVTADRPRKKGTHRMDGMFLLAGPGVKRVQGATAAIEDAASLILYLLGLPVPEDMDGHVPLFVFQEDFLDAHPVRLAAPGQASSASAGAYDAEEERAIKERLEGIGYLD